MPEGKRVCVVLFFYENTPKKTLGWEPRTKFAGLVEIMVKEDLERWQRWRKGERFPWDAPGYPSENRILSRLFHPEKRPEEMLEEGTE